MMWILLWAIRDYWTQPQPVTAWSHPSTRQYSSSTISRTSAISARSCRLEVGNDVTSFFVLSIVGGGHPISTRRCSRCTNPPRWTAVGDESAAC